MQQRVECDEGKQVECDGSVSSSSTADGESCREKFSAFTLNDQNETDKIILFMYKWSKFILLSDHSNDNLANEMFYQSKMVFMNKTFVFKYMP